MKKSLKTGLVALIMLFATSNIFAQVSIGISISARIAPPPLPVYSQPPCPTDGYLWVPGYWAWSDDLQDYYWVPGAWVAPPRPGLLWTPAYWGYTGGVYGFHAGYWGAHVGFYGGINYGYGYCGTGFVGGGWSGDHFRYNTAVVNVNKTVVHNTYVDETVNVHNTVINNNNRVSFNGGQGGVQARPRPEEMAAMREQHIQPTAEQTTHQNHAMQDRSQFFKNNGGRPERAAVNRVGGTQFRGANNAPRSQQNAGQPMGRNGNNPRFNGNANDTRSNGANANQVHANAMDVNNRNNQIKSPDAYHNSMNQPQPGNHAPQNNMQQQHMHAMQQSRMQQPHMQPQHIQAPRMQQPHMARPQPHEERRH